MPKTIQELAREALGYFVLKERPTAKRSGP